MKIALIRGTTRPNNRTQYVTKMVKEIIQKSYPELDIIDISPDMYDIVEGNKEENNNTEWIELNKTLDGYVIVTPEYNHGVPGSLKMLIDEDFNYEHKAVGLVGVSNGPWGGTRAIESLLPVLKATGMTMIRRDAHMTWVQDNISETGELTISEAALAKFTGEVEGMLKEFVWMLEALTKAR